MTVLVRWAAPVDAASVIDLLDPGDRERLAALHIPADRDRFATGRALLRLGVSRLLGGPARAVVLDATCAGCGGPHGRPVLIEPGGDWQLSVSHEADRVVVALADGTGIGVDVAPWTATDFAGFDDIALTSAERAEVLALPPRRQGQARTALWVAKEAVLKLQGVGLDVEPNTLHVGVAAALLETVGSGPAWLTDIDVGRAYCARLATSGDAPPRVEIVDANGWLAAHAS